ncbi:MAG: nitroreductase family protein [Eisenbergiella sp.]
MNTSDAIRSRRSIRKYKKGSVIPKEHIRLLLEAAMMAPSACNTRPWEFVVVESEEIQEKITAIHLIRRC